MRRLDVTLDGGLTLIWYVIYLHIPLFSFILDFCFGILQNGHQEFRKKSFGLKSR
jgi:hypothetical protein